MIIVDVETTGLEPEKNAIVSVGAVNFDYPNIMFYEECRLRKGAEINPIALEINGFTEEEVRDPNKKSLKELIKLFNIWADNVEDKTLAGENPHLDLDFLKHSAKLYGAPWPFGYRIVDLHSISFIHHLGSGLKPLEKGKTNLSLDETLKYVGLKTEPKPHHALTGAKLETEAFSRILCGKNLLSEYKKYAIPKYLKRK